jgi:hypothetical protein
MRRNDLSDAEMGDAEMGSVAIITIHFHLSCENSNVSRSDYLLHEFQHVFRNDPAEAIERAFRRHRNRTADFPAICDIRYELDCWHDERREAAAAEAKAAEIKDCDA